MSETLYQRYLQLNKQGVHQCDAAAALGVSEGELTASFPYMQYLGGNIEAFLPELAALGEVKSVVRNSVAVHEKTGVYTNLELSPVMGTAINQGGLDLRLFLHRWKHILAMKADGRHAFHFYDAYGKTVQKVLLTDEAAVPQWERLCGRYRQDGAPVFEPRPADTPYLPVSLDHEQAAAYRQAWQGLKNVHHFRMVLADFGIDRLQGLEYAPEGDAQRLQPAAVEEVLQQCAARGITLLVFVNNSGIVQIQTGRVHHVGRAGGCLNILDDAEEGFSLHLKDGELAQVWFVRRPGSSGVVHSIEAYDRNRNLVLQLFGRPADAPAEPEAWRGLMAQVCGQYGL